MLKNLWEKVKAIAEGRDTEDEATYAARHQLLVDLDTRLKGIEDYLENTPNHIGKVYTPASTDVADVADPATGALQASEIS